MDEKISKFELHKIREWLSKSPDDRRLECPFGSCMTWEDELGHCRSVCGKLFRKVKDNLDLIDKVGEAGYPVECPCTCYKQSYVVRRARILLARKGRFKREPRSWQRSEKRFKAKD